MALFKLHLRCGDIVDHDDGEFEWADLTEARLEVWKAIPDVARDLLVEGKDPMLHAYVIHDEAGSQLLVIRFSEILSSHG